MLRLYHSVKPTDSYMTNTTTLLPTVLATVLNNDLLKENVSMTMTMHLFLLINNRFLTGLLLVLPNQNTCACFLVKHYNFILLLPNLCFLVLLLWFQLWFLICALGYPCVHSLLISRPSACLWVLFWIVFCTSFRTIIKDYCFEETVTYTCIRQHTFYSW